MKKYVLQLVLLFLCFNGIAQFRKIPAEVTDSFKARYANASGVSWKDKLSAFQADFEVNNRKMKAYYSSKGEWIKTESQLSVKTLPAEVLDGFKKSKYAALEVLEAMELEEGNSGKQYKVVVKKTDFGKKSLLFSASGQLLSDNLLL